MREKISFLFCATLLVLTSCQSQLPLMVPEAGQPEEATVTGWVSLSDGTFHQNEEGVKPEGYYIKVRRKTWQSFHPTSDILGKGAAAPESAKKQPGWIELDDGSIHPVEQGVVPRPPYVRGYIDEKGRFYPEPQKIVK